MLQPTGAAQECAEARRPPRLFPAFRIMKNILVPTDFSPEAHHAFEVAVRLAGRTGGRVTLLHALELPETAGFSTYGGPVGGSELPNSSGGVEEVYALKLLQVTKHRMADLVAEAARLAPTVPVRDMVQTSRVGSAILQVIDEQGIDLVVMGAQGHTAIEYFFLGSNTERLVRTAPCPVLTVKHPAGPFEVRTLLFPSDFSAEADRAVPELRRVRAVFPDATLHLLHIVADAHQRQNALDTIDAFATRHQLKNYKPAVVVAPRPAEAIPQFVKLVEADLVLLPTHGRTGLSRLLQTSIAETVATQSFPPVLTFRL